MNDMRTTLTILGLLAATAGCNGGASTTQDPFLFPVKRADLPITVRENAELQALRETIVRSEVEGQSTIIFIVPEGTVVKQGDKLIELDVSELVEKASNQEIAVEKARSALEQARTQQNILVKEHTARRNTAISQLEIARMALEKLLGARDGKGSEGKNADMVRRLRELVTPPATAHDPADEHAAAFTRVNPASYGGLVDKAIALLTTKDSSPEESLARDMGEMANKILQQADQIRLAMADLKVKEDTVTHSRKLAAKRFITRNELERDELAYQSQASKVTIAWNDLELLINYTLQTERIRLTQDYENALLELDRVEASNDAERKKSQFDIDAKEKEFTLATERLENLRRQIRNAVVLAPTPGTVVYARIDRNRGGGEAVREGIQVRERQELIILPDTTKMRCVVKVQEAQVDKVMRGQPAHVTVEAFQGETFTGRVTSVAPVADSNSGWMTSDRKVYTTIVELDSDNPDGRLRSRMAANVTISVETVPNTLPVPLQAVFRDRSVNYVWKRTPRGPEAVRVRVGRQNSERVEILDGVVEGDVLHLVAPTGVPEPKFEQPVAPEPAPLQHSAPANGNASTAGNAGSGSGGDTARRVPGAGRMGLMSKRLADMTPEEIETYKGMLDGMSRMVDGARQAGNAEVADEVETTLAALRAALDKNDLAAGQTHKDRLSALMRRLTPNRGDGGERPRRGSEDGAGRRGGN